MAALLLLKSMILSTALRKDKKRQRTDIHRLINKKRNQKCRICNEAEASIPIFDNKWKRNIAEEIERISGVAIANNGRHSQQICQQCLDLLNSCIQFRETCQRTQKLLNDESLAEDYIDPDDKIDNSESDYDPNNDDENSLDDDFNELLEEELNRTLNDQGNDWEKQTCWLCLNEYADKKSYNLHLPFCEARLELEDEKKPIIKKANNKRVKKKTTTEKVKHKTFLCDTCGKICMNKRYLIQHMTIHSNVFPFKCDVCPYRGRSLFLLKTHKRIHLAVKPYKCDLCPKTTTTCSNLRRHIMSRHKQPDRNVKCTYCDKSCTNKFNLKKHIWDIHLRQIGGYDCDICFQKFRTHDTLRGHRMKIHKVRPAPLGRLPAYLLHQMEVERENEQHNNMMDGDTGEE